MKYSIGFLGLLLYSIPALAQKALEPSHPAWKNIVLANNEMSKKMVAGDAAFVQESYAVNAVIMPEHSKVCQGKSEVGQYYRLWLDSVDVTAYERTIGELSDLGGELLEIGSFSQTFTRKDKKPYMYEGKYLVLWDKKDGTLYKTAEIWGANASFERTVLPEIIIDSTDDGAFAIDTKLEKEVQARNSIIDKLVTERNGAEHASLFLPDARYFTYYTPPLIGIEAITTYFTEHEKPGDVIINNLELKNENVYGLSKGSTVVEHGYYTVDFTAGTYKGSVDGKSINIWKRDKKGVLMLYCQMVNHD